MQDTQPYEQRENEHIYYPTVKNRKIIWALLFILCVVVPVFHSIQKASRRNGAKSFTNTGDVRRFTMGLSRKSVNLSGSMRKTPSSTRQG